MPNNYWARLTGLGYLSILAWPVNANVPVWENWSPLYPDPGTFSAPPFQADPGFEPRFQSVSYSRPASPPSVLSCSIYNALDLPDPCIQRSHASLRGLQEQAEYLQRQTPGTTVAPLWGRVSNQVLLETARRLLDWHEGLSPGALREQFSLMELSSGKRADHADYTGYFTPVLPVRLQPDAEFRFPIYRKPSGALARLSHNQIAHHGLSGKGLEIAWTNDVVNLYFAQIQGSVIARFPDGREQVLYYDGHNGQNFRSIADYMKQRGYKPRNFSNEGMRDWLRANPDKISEVLTYNPRYVFFNLRDGLPLTSSGTPVIAGHTIAVDSRYIPLGAVLLAEVPRIDGNGRETGSDWRLLFAQDHGSDIKGAGRLDLYTGIGPQAETVAHSITGFRKTYLLLRKPTAPTRVAGL